MNDNVDALVIDSEVLERTISVMLAGTDPRVVGSALIGLTATYLASHHPAVRNEIRKLHEETVRSMIPVAEGMFAKRGWQPWTPEPPRPNRYKPVSVKTADAVERFLVIPENLNAEDCIFNGGRELSGKVIAQCSKWNVASRVAIALNLLAE